MAILIDRLPCGCRHDGTTWLNLCPIHRAEFDETHARWACERIEQQRRNDAATRYL